MNRLQGKTALVTAAGQGIGRAIAEAFVREGAKVWATDLDVAKLEGLEGAEKRRLDVLSERGCQELVAEAGPLDILVNAPASCITARFSNAPTRIGISRST